MKAREKEEAWDETRETDNRQPEAPGEMARRKATGAQPLGRRKRKIGSDVDCGGVVGGVFRRQATGGRGRRRSTGQSFVLSATGNFHRRLRKDLEGVPEVIADVRKNLVSGERRVCHAVGRAKVRFFLSFSKFVRRAVKFCSTNNP